MDLSANCDDLLEEVVGPLQSVPRMHQRSVASHLLLPTRHTCACTPFIVATRLQPPPPVIRRAGAARPRGCGPTRPPALALLPQRGGRQLLPALPHGECAVGAWLLASGDLLQLGAHQDTRNCCFDCCLPARLTLRSCSSAPADSHGVPVQPSDHPPPAPRRHGVCCVSWRLVSLLCERAAVIEVTLTSDSATWHHPCFAQRCLRATG